MRERTRILGGVGMTFGYAAARRNLRGTIKYHKSSDSLDSPSLTKATVITVNIIST